MALVAGCSFLLAAAQDTTMAEKPQMADAMRANGKIYVVVAVLLVILAGLITYVARLDRKISRMEEKGS